MTTQKATLVFLKRHEHVMSFMKFLLLLPTATATKGAVFCRPWLRCMSSAPGAFAKASTRAKPVRDATRDDTDDRRLSFPALGLEPHFVKALHKAFPDVHEPTAVQAKLIPEVLGRKDILLRDVTGSGK